MTRVKIKEGIIEVDDKPYHVTELFLQGRVTGVVNVNKHTGFYGELESSTPLDAALDYSGVLIIREHNPKQGNLKLEISEQRKNLLLKTPDNNREAYEIVMKIDNANISLAATFYPKRITLYCDPNTVTINERPFIIYIHVKSRE